MVLNFRNRINNKIRNKYVFGQSELCTKSMHNTNLLDNECDIFSDRDHEIAAAGM